MLLNVVLISKLLNNSLTSCSLINLDFGNTTDSTLDNNIVSLLLVFKTLGLKMYFVLQFKQNDSIVLHLRL